MARSMSAMPGPLSRAMTSTAGSRRRLADASIVCISTSPWPAWVRMLRATSEMAVAISVASVEEQPIWAASSRPDCRATTMSPSVEMTILMRPSDTQSPAQSDVEEGEALLEVQGGVHVLEPEPELHHREGDLGLHAHDHGVRPAQQRHVGDRAQRPRRERIHHVEGRDVDDDAPGPVDADLAHEVVAQAYRLAVRHGRLDGGDQVVALLQDGNGHRGSAQLHR